MKASRRIQCSFSISLKSGCSKTHEERDEKVETEGGSLGGGLSTSEKTGPGDIHGDGLSGSSDQEEGSSTGSLDNDEGQQGEQGVDDSEDSSEDQGQITTELDLLLEENGGVVDDSVTSSELLVDLGRGTNDHSSQVLLLSTDEHVLGGSLRLPGSVDRFHNVCPLLQSTGVVHRSAGQSGNDLETFVHVSVRQQPSGRLRHDEGSPDDKEREQGLQSDGESPRERAVDLVLK